MAVLYLIIADINSSGISVGKSMKIIPIYFYILYYIHIIFHDIILLDILYFCGKIFSSGLWMEYP